MSEATTSAEQLDAVIVGAGFAGLYMLHRLRGLGFGAASSRPATASAAPGTGTAIPGARCDIESLEYSYSFSPGARAGVELDRALRRPAGDPALPQPRRRPLRPARATSSSRPA